MFVAECATLDGTVEKVLFKSDDGTFSVASLAINARNKVVITGVLPPIHQGERLSVVGEWKVHPKFGRQFEVKECTAQLPSSIHGIKKYLASGLIKGIGPKFAQRLVNCFGSKTLEVIDKEPHKLRVVGGIGTGRIHAIVEAWKEQKEISRVMIFLQERDISTDFAVKIFKRYGFESIAKMQENPYRLTEDIWGVGFKTADRVALKLGFEVLSGARIKAAIVHILKERGTRGHLYGCVDAVKGEAATLLEHDTDAINTHLKRALHDLYEEHKIVLISHGDVHYLALPSYYFSEKGIAQRIHQLAAHTSSHTFDFNAIYRDIAQPAHGIALNNDQQKGILLCLQHKVSVITGGPGTGKTTLIRTLLDVLERNKVALRLAAPTGRAAKRMFEGTGRHAETLHRLLEFSPASMSFEKHEHNALQLDFLIVDEASMIDVFMMHALLRALPLKAHVVFIGDVDQLPSVGPGNVLTDLIASKKVSIVRLTEIFRQAQDSLIITNAHRINQGEFPRASGDAPRKDFMFMRKDNPEDVLPTLAYIYQRILPKHGIDTVDTVVLSPMNRGIAGTQRINQELQVLLNPQREQKQVMRFGMVYRVGDRVMQIRNNYDTFVFNGDMGDVVDINHEDQNIVIRFGTRDILYDISQLDEVVLSYAISIHKSQGSEFNAVIVPIFMQHFVMLARNLIYTAITRAKKLCIFIGQPRAIAMGIKNDKSVKRLTLLQEFLTSDLSAR